MDGNSKRERVDSFIRRAVREAIHEYNFTNGDRTIGQASRDITMNAAYRISGDPYRMKELQDIMDWKKPPREK